MKYWNSLGFRGKYLQCEPIKFILKKSEAEVENL